MQSHKLIYKMIIHAQDEGVAQMIVINVKHQSSCKAKQYFLS